MLQSPDARYFQVIFQAAFLSFGIFLLHWDPDWSHYIATIGGCLAFQYLCDSAFSKRLLRPGEFKRWGLSVLISAVSLCLLLRTNHWYVSLLAAFLTVASKYVFRLNRKHIFNPSAFGIVATIAITRQAWLSPGQWGNSAILFFSAVTLGTIVVTRVQKLDVSLAFLLTYAGLLYWRQVHVLGWPMDYFTHSITNGGLLLFTFFMISDPKTSPNHFLARVFWSILMAIASFYLAAFKWKYNAAVWVLVAAAPLVPLLNKICPGEPFQWKTSLFHFTIFSKLKNIVMKPLTKKLAAILIMVAMISHEAFAFCGIYVSKADGTLKNKTSQVILVRDGDRTVITMYNDFEGNMSDFAMVVPVPVVLKKADIKVVDQKIFSTLNDYSQPRLVEYYDENPCQPVIREDRMSTALQGNAPGLEVDKFAPNKRETVKVEARYIVGEYDILILSATESAGLKDWLNQNGYKMPGGAEEVLEPYIKSNMKFFVVKVDEKEKKKLPGNFLRPIQISFNSPRFMLPIRLGMANADGDQDLVVYAFTKTGRIECTNYRTVSLPTGKNIPLFVQDNFANFYSNLFQHQWTKEGRSVAMLEYAWNVSPSNYLKCDPCVATAPSTQDLVQAGVWWIKDGDIRNSNDYSDNVYFTRLHIRYNRKAFPQDLMFQATPNTDNFQARYIITHPAAGDLTCAAGIRYLEDLKERRQQELAMLSYLTGKSYNDWDVVAGNVDDKNIPRQFSYTSLASSEKPPKKDQGVLVATLGIMGLVTAVGFRKKPQKIPNK